MKIFFTLICSIAFLFSLGQTDKLMIQVQVVDKNDRPVSDVYIVNMNSQEKDVSRTNGVFTLWVTPGDSLAVSHISYERKIVSANSVLINPKIVLESESVNIKEIRVSAKTDMDRAMENIEQIKLDMRTRPDDILTESERVNQVVTANNRIARASAGMLSIAKFSPSTGIKKVSNALKKDVNGFSSTKKTKEEVDEKKVKKEARKIFYRKLPEADSAKTDTLNIEVQDSIKIIKGSTQK